MLDEFKFKIGDVVRHKLSANQTQRGGDRWLDDGENKHNECRAIIVTRHLEEGHGGVQRKYSTRIVYSTGGVSLDIILFHEEELVLSEPFPPNPPSESRRGRG